MSTIFDYFAPSRSVGYPTAMSVARALAWNTGVQLIGKVVSTIFGIFVVGLLTRLLGQAGFGLYTAANSYLQIFALALDLGINVTFTALLGEHAGDEAYEKRCVSALFTLRILMAVIVLGLAPLLWWLIFPQEQIMLLAIVALNGSVFFPALNQILIGLQQRHLRMHIPAIGEVIGRALLLGGLLIGMALHFPLISLLWLITLGSLGHFLFTLAFLKPRGRLGWNWDPAFWKATLARSWPIGVSIAFNLVYFKADTFILSRVRSLEEVGVYGAAYRVLEILITIPFMYAGLLLPLLSQVWAKKDKKRFGDYLSRSFEIMGYLIAPILVGTMILGPKIMTLVSGPAFAASGYILRILILAVAIIFLNTITSHAIVALNTQRQMLPIYILVAIGTLTGYFLFIPSYGMWAAAWLTVGSELGIFIGSWIMTRRHVTFHPGLWTTFATGAAALGMGAVVWLLRDRTIFLAIGAGALVYPVLLLLFGAVTRDHLRTIWKPELS